MERFVIFSLAAGVGHSGEPQWIACTRDLKGGGHKAGKKFEVNKTVIGRKTVEKRSWKFDSGIIYNCGKERSTGGGFGGEGIRNGIPLRETQFRSREGVL